MKEKRTHMKKRTVTGKERSAWFESNQEKRKDRVGLWFETTWGRDVDSISEIKFTIIFSRTLTSLSLGCIREWVQREHNLPMDCHLLVQECHCLLLLHLFSSSISFVFRRQNERWFPVRFERLRRTYRAASRRLFPVSSKITRERERERWDESRWERRSQLPVFVLVSLSLE